MTDDPRILVATDNQADAELVQDILKVEFDFVSASTAPASAVADFDAARPAVLVLAYKSLESAQRHYLGLFRGSSLIQTLAHRAIVLCSQGNARRAYELCRNGQFDDYVLFWPASHDPNRLLMAVHHARRLTAEATDAPTASGMAPLAHRIGELDGLLAKFTKQANQEIDAAERALAKSPQDAGKVLQPVRQAVRTLKDTISPHLESVRALKAMAAKVLPLVLVVDDDDYQRKLMERMMGPLNIETSLAASAFEASAAIRARKPDLIFMDVSMPDIDGVEMTRRIKAEPTLSDIPIVMVTGNSDKETVSGSLKAGAVDFLVKPVVAETLKRKIELHLARHSNSDRSG